MFGLGSTTPTDDGVMDVVEVCKYMGWSYNDFCDAPQWLLDAIIIRMTEEGKARAAAEAQANHGTGS